MADGKTPISTRLSARGTVLILLDVITDFEFEDGDALLKRTIPAAKNIAQLKRRAKTSGVPVIYVNDNFGKWQEDFKTMADHFRRPASKGREVIDLLQPERDDLLRSQTPSLGFLFDDP